MDLTLAEKRVDGLARQIEMQLSTEDLFELVTSGRYAKSIGMKRGEHFRADRGIGCYHLRVGEETAYLHWDGYDPRRAPVRHVMETPLLLVGAVAAASVVAAVTAALGAAIYFGKEKS